MLFIANTLDPLTPITGAIKTQRRFRDSVLLQQNSGGHISIGGAGGCTFAVVNIFFATGTLPAKGTVCEIDNPPFGVPLPPVGGAPKVKREAEAEGGKWVELQRRVAEVMAGRMMMRG